MPNIRYLMFANDYVNLCRITKIAVRNLKNIFDHYC